jgi:hypothetical protein
MTQCHPLTHDLSLLQPRNSICYPRRPVLKGVQVHRHASFWTMTRRGQVHHASSLSPATQTALLASSRLQSQRAAPSRASSESALQWPRPGLALFHGPLRMTCSRPRLGMHDWRHASECLLNVWDYRLLLPSAWEQVFCLLWLHRNLLQYHWNSAASALDGFAAPGCEAWNLN